MADISSGWAKYLEPILKEAIHDGYSEHPDSTSQIFKIDEDASGVIRVHDSWGPGVIPTSSENAASSELSRVKGYETVLSPQIFKGKLPVSEEYDSRGMYSEIKNEAADLGRAAVTTINRYVFGIVIQATLSGYANVYGDAKNLASVGHPRPDGGTAQSNASATGVTLTETNLETGTVALKQQLGGSGRKLSIGSGDIVLQVPEQLDKEAQIITGSQLRSGTGNNDLNWYLGKINTYVNPWLGSDVTDLDGNSGVDTAWSLLAMREHRLSATYEKRPMFKTWEDEDTDTLNTKIKFSLRPFWAGWYGTWFSIGGGASYSL